MFMFKFANMEEQSISDVFDGSGVPKLNNNNDTDRCQWHSGALVVHKTKSWPWIGVVQIHHSTLRCTSCGLPTARSSATFPHPIGSEYDDDGDDGEDEEAIMESPSIMWNDFGTLTDHGAGCCESGSTPPHPSAAAAVTEGCRCNESCATRDGERTNSRRLIIWHPNLEMTNSDGNEIVVGSTARRFFQDGQSLERITGDKRRGIAKRVLQQIDALVLPECEYVLTDVYTRQLHPIRDIEQHAGVYVIYNGWLGAVYSVTNKVHFRMDDGVELSLIDFDRDMTIHLVESLSANSDRPVPVDSTQMFPGMRVTAPISLLQNAVWITQPSETLLNLVAFWNSPTSVELEHGRASKIDLTVVSVSTEKVGVEWRCQVAGTSDSHQPNDSIIDGDHLKQMQLFRVPFNYLQHKGLASRSRYTIEPHDRVITVEQWRQELIAGKRSPITAGATTPLVGREVYLYQVMSKTNIDVLWEDGTMEHAIDSEQLVFSTGSDASRDYFPAMYVQLESRSADAEVRDRVGLILSCSNVDKFARVDWYRPVDGELVKLETTETSFYDIRSHADYNYLTGTLVARLNCTESGITTSRIDRPNVGYVLQKRFDGKVIVRWFGCDEDAVENPWHLCKLRVDGRYGDAESVCSDVSTTNGAPNVDGYYSPTEHEWDDLEDLRYFDYLKMDDSERWTRIAMLCELLTPVLNLLHKALLTAASQLPMLERRQMVRFVLHTEDILAGFCQLDRFKDVMRQFYMDHLGIDLSNSGKKKDAGSVGASAGSNDDDELVLWSMSTWMYDWLEVTAELQQAVNRHKAKMNKQHKLSSKDNDTESSCGTAASSIVDETPPTPSSSALTSIEEWSHLVQAAFTTTSQILASGQSIAHTTPLVVDCVQSMSKHCVDDLCQPSDDELRTAFHFMKTFQLNGKKIGRLPCFSYALPPEPDLRLLSEEWHLSSVNDKQQPHATLHGSSVLLSSKDALAIVTHKSTARLQMVDESKKAGGLSFAPEDVVPMIQEVADSLTLATVTVLRRVLCVIRAECEKCEYWKPIRSPIVDPIAIVPTTVVDTSDMNGISVNDNETRLCAHSFQVVERAPLSHRFYPKAFDGNTASKSFLAGVRKEIRLLQTALPDGIVVKTYEDRMDLLSSLIVGPQGTPYAGGLFIFDVRLKDDYPMRPPHVFFKSYSKRLNPNLYVDGMVCLSLLATWDGAGTELWTSSSTLLQVFLSMQSLVLVADPYYLEPGYEKERSTEIGRQKSREYNESAILLTLHSLQRIVNKPPEPFVDEVRAHFLSIGPKLMRQLDDYINDADNVGFDLAPTTQGFRLCIDGYRRTLGRLYDDLSGVTATTSDQHAMDIDDDTFVDCQ